MATVTKPIALDRSLNTTESPSRNIADVLAEELSAMITAIGGLNFINFVVVAELPTTGISTTTIYLVPSDDPQSENTYDEYINLNGTVSGWEKIGSTDIDLSGYYTSAEVDDLLADKADVSDIPTVNDGTLTIQQNGDIKGTFTANQSGNSTVNIETPTTDIQTAVDEFETYNGGILDSLKVSLSPNQDLHGYSEPWVGGAGKNKLPLNLAWIKSNNTQGTWNGNSYTYNGVTFTVNTDINEYVTKIETSGTASNNGSFYLYNGLTLDSGYILNGCPSTGGSSTYRIRLRYGSSDYFVDTGSGSEITSPVTSYGSIDIRFNSGANMNGLKFYPMIRLATETDPTFEPYENICPISGHTQVDVDVSDGQATQEQIVVNLGGTYYSGTLDVVSGVMTVTKKGFDMGDVEWFTDTTSQIGKIRFCVWMSDIKQVASNIQADIISTEYAPTTADRVYQCNQGICASSTRIGIYDETKQNMSVSDFKTAMTGQKIVYELATPITIQLTPTMVKALVGKNHLSTPLDGQSIDSVKYREVFAFDDVEKVVSLRVPISMFGTDESGRTTASKSYASGDYFYKDGYMCKALTSISAGATLTLNTNYSQGTLADILKAIENS